MSEPTPTKDLLRQIELAWFNLSFPPVKSHPDLLRHELQSSILALREQITPRGDPLFSQLGANKRALQLVVLAGEHFMMRGWPHNSGPEVALMEAALVAAKHVAEEHAR